MHVEEEVNKALVKLVPSSTVFVELANPAGQTLKFKTRYIGFLPEFFILLKMPDLQKNRKLAAFLQDTVHCTVRSVIEGHEGMIVAFQTSIKINVKSPTSMMALNIPKKVAIQQLRKVNRMDTEIPVETRIKNIGFSGIMLNMSPLGCLVNVRGISKDFALEEHDNIEVKITDEHLDSPGTLQGEICNIKKLHDGEHIGIKFNDVSEVMAMTLLNQILFSTSH